MVLPNRGFAMTVKKAYPVLVGMLALFFLVGCTPEPPTVRLSAISGGNEEPTILFEGFRMVSTQGKTTEWAFEARAAQIHEKINSAKAQDIKIVYWRDKEVISTLTAKRGLIKTDTQNMTAEEDVFMTSHDGVTIRTERLDWDQENELISTDLPVRVEREGSILTGIGMEADSELKNIKILKNVKIKVKSIDDFKSPFDKGKKK